MITLAASWPWITRPRMLCEPVAGRVACSSLFGVRDDECTTLCMTTILVQLCCRAAWHDNHQ